MKTPGTIGKSVILVAFLTLLLLNGSAVRGEDRGSSIKAQSKVTHAERKADWTSER